MTVTINGSGTMTGLAVGGLNDNIITKNEMATGGAWAPAGTVLQVVNATYSTPVSTTSATLVSTGLSASITPSSVNSKILIVGSVNAVFTNATSTGVTVAAYKNTVTNALAVGQWYAAFSPVSADNQTNVPFSYLDSPATTSAVTYGFSFYRLTGSGTAYVQTNNSTSFITLMEIAA